MTEPESTVPPTRAERLARKVAFRADPDGFVPFDRFMDVALYDAEVGYYAGGRTPFGPHGDFYTAVHVHPMFSLAVARRAALTARALGPDRPFRFVELGPGDGSLTEVVVRELLRTGVRPREVVLVDRSPSLREAAVARAELVAGPAEIPVRALGAIAELGPFEGFVVANELLDAQPVRRYRRDPSGWVELGVRVSDARVDLAERTGVPAPPGSGTEGPGTVTIERSGRAEAILREVADHLVRGTCVVLDYGAEEPELFAGHPRGTLATARGHRPGSDPLESVGEQDLSAFVNFTRVRAAARAAGLTERASRSQAEALVAWGLEDLFREALASAHGAEEEVKLRLALKSLLYNFGTFRAIEWEAGR